MKEITKRQKGILEFIQKHFSTNGFWPSIREIQKNFGFKSTNAVMGHLRALEQKDYITRSPGQARAYQFCQKAKLLVGASSDTISIPIFGSITAGYPDHVESAGAIGNLQMDVSTAGIRNGQRTFALKVRGESMIDAGIQDGDLVIVEKGEPRNNDIVAALIDGETTLKRYINAGNESPFLRADNANYPDLLPATELKIQGIARSIVRCL